MVLSHGEDIKADLVSESSFVNDVAQPLGGRDGSSLRIRRDITECIEAKFEWGHVDGQLILIDEVLTPDSSRFWPADQYEPGHGQPSFDKQFVRDYLTSTGWDKDSDPPVLPEGIVSKTREKYIEAFDQLTGSQFAWK